MTVEIPVQGLTPNTTYHFRVVATSDGGTVNGDDATFRTAATVTAPAVSTGGVSDVGDDAATLTAAINPHGASTTYRFEWGTSSRLGTSTPTGSLAASTRSSTVRTRIGGLTAGKKYYYRVVATNSAGTTRGSTRTFTAASTATSATLSASADPRDLRQGRDAQRQARRLEGLAACTVKLQTTTFPFSAPVRRHRQRAEVQQQGRVHVLAAGRDDDDACARRGRRPAAVLLDARDDPQRGADRHHVGDAPRQRPASSCAAG